MRLLTAILFLLAAAAQGQTKRVLYLTHAAGFRHDVLPFSAEVLRSVAASTGRIDVTWTEDVSALNRLNEFDAVVFYTSGELPITESQKTALLEFVRSGKGFGGFHSATDTLYQWPEYGRLIGAWFNGHPWTREAAVDVEDPRHPASANLGNSFRLVEEFYQFRDFSRERSRVLMTLDFDSVPQDAEGVNPNTRDFPLVWVHPYGNGRVFYSAFGHLESTWRDPRFQQMAREALLWLTGLISADALPHPPRSPEILDSGIGNAASLSPANALAPGTIFSIYGRALTSGNTASGDSLKLAGTRVFINNQSVPLFYVSPAQINGLLPITLPWAGCPNPPFFVCRGQYYEVRIETPIPQPVTVRIEAATETPGVFTATVHSGYFSIWATGLGLVERRGDFDVTFVQPEVLVAGAPAHVLYSGLAPGFPGVYQVNVATPSNLPSPAPVEFRFGGEVSRFLLPLP